MNIQTNTVNSVNAKRPYSAKKNLSFTAEQLKKLHWVDGMSLTQIGVLYGVSASAISHWMNKFGLAGRSHVDNLLFEPSPALSYVLGVILGDGCVYLREKGNYTVRLNVCDKVFAERFSEAVRLLGFTPGRIIRVKAQREEWRDAWLSYFYSNAFGNWYTTLSLDERLEMGIKFPDAFTRGFYESEGTLTRHHGRLELSMSDTHGNGKILTTIQNHLPHGITSHCYSFKRKDGATVYQLEITRGLDVRRFLAWVMPCIKVVPRSEYEEMTKTEKTHADTEAIPDRNVGAAVENTKVTQNGKRVGLRSVMDGVQPSGLSQQIRCIPTYKETCRGQQKCSVPGKAVTFL